MIKTIPKKKKCKKAQWLSEEVVQIAEKIREAKDRKKGKIHPFGCEFQRQQRDFRKCSSVISAQKQRKTIEWERLEISSRK